MIPPQQAGQSMNYDPLMSEFLTQGQMEHMPQAQYMTPKDYGAFRSMPGMQQQGAMPQQQMSMWQAYMIQNRGRIPFTGSEGSPYVFDTYNPAAEQSWYQTMASRRWQDAQLGMGAGAMDVGTQMAGGAAIGAVAGGPAGLAAGLMMGEVSAPITDRRKGMREIQSQTMQRVMGGPDVSEGLGYGFSAPAAGRLDESIRRQSAGDLVFKQEDYRELMDLGIDQGLFDFDMSEQQYEGKLKTLRDNVEVMQKLLGSTDFKELTKSMKKLLDMGMDPEMMGSGTRMQAGFGFTAGRSVQQMSEAFGQPGAMAFNQAGLTPYQGSFQAMSSAANVEMARRLGIYEPGEVARRGGVSGMVQNETQATGRLMGQEGGLGDLFLGASMNEDMEVNPEMVNQIESGDISFQEIVRRAGRNIGKDPQEFWAKKDRNKEDFMDEAGPQGIEAMEFNMASQLGQELNPEGSKQEQLFAGYTSMYSKVMPAEEARKLAQQRARRESKPEFWETKLSEEQTKQRQMEKDERERQAYYDSPLREMAVDVREGMHGLYENSFVAEYMRGRRRDIQREENRKMGVYGGLNDYTDIMSISGDFNQMMDPERRASDLAEVIRGDVGQAEVTTEDVQRRIENAGDLQGNRDQAENLLTSMGVSDESVGEYAPALTGEEKLTDKILKSIRDEIKELRSSSEREEEHTQDLLGLLKQADAKGEEKYREVLSKYGFESQQIDRVIESEKFVEASPEERVQILEDEVQSKRREGRISSINAPDSVLNGLIEASGSTLNTEDLRGPLSDIGDRQGAEDFLTSIGMGEDKLEELAPAIAGEEELTREKLEEVKEKLSGILNVTEEEAATSKEIRDKLKESSGSEDGLRTMLAGYGLGSETIDRLMEDSEFVQASPENQIERIQSEMRKGRTEDIQSLISEKGISNQKELQEFLVDEFDFDSGRAEEVTQREEVRSALMGVDADTRESIRSAINSSQSIEDITDLKHTNPNESVDRLYKSYPGGQLFKAATDFMGITGHEASKEELRQIGFAKRGIEEGKGAEDVGRVLQEEYNVEDFSGGIALSRKLSERNIQSPEDVDEGTLHQILKEDLNIKDKDKREEMIQDREFMTSLQGAIAKSSEGNNYKKEVYNRWNERQREIAAGIDSKIEEAEEQAEGQLSDFVDSNEDKQTVRQYMLSEEHSQAFKFAGLADAALKNDGWSEDSEGYKATVTTLKDMGVENAEEVAKSVAKGNMDKDTLKQVADQTEGLSAEDIRGMMDIETMDSDRIAEDPQQFVEKIGQVREGYGEAAVQLSVGGMMADLGTAGLDLETLREKDASELKKEYEDEDILDIIDASKKVKENLGEDASMAEYKEAMGAQAVGQYSSGDLVDLKPFMGDSQSEGAHEQSEDTEENIKGILENLRSTLGEGDLSIQDTLKKNTDALEGVEKQLQMNIWN